VVISNHALEHCRDPFRELVEMKRVLRPGGRAVLILPLEDWRRSRHFRRNDINRHLYGWTPLLIANLVTEAGFEVRDVSIVRHAYPPGVGLLWPILPESMFDIICAAGPSLHSGVKCTWSRAENK
jgi:SAM-dependent methyltransferase